jgi:hypothetical protein
MAVYCDSEQNIDFFTINSDTTHTNHKALNG